MMIQQQAKRDGGGYKLVLGAWISPETYRTVHAARAAARRIAAEEAAVRIERDLLAARYAPLGGPR